MKMKDRYRVAHKIIMSRLEAHQRERLECGDDSYRNREFAREVIRLAESNDEEDQMLIEIELFKEGNHIMPSLEASDITDIQPMKSFKPFEL
jgi:hypothetical protein